MSEQGKCPKCGSLDLDYGAMEHSMGDEEVYYPFTCGNCGFAGRECYHLKFILMTDEEGEEV